MDDIFSEYAAKQKSDQWWRIESQERFQVVINFKFYQSQFQVGKGINFYWSMLFCPIGFAANIFSFLVMSMKHNRHLSTCIYMMTIAVSDNVKLYSVFHVWLVEYFHLQNYSSWLCKVRIFVGLLAGMFGAFQIVLMTLDKVIAVKLPHRAKSICTAKRAKLLSIINLILSVIFNLPILNLTEQSGNTRFCIRFAKKGWYVTVYSFIHIVVNPMIPFALLFMMNIIIIKTVWQSARLRRSQQENSVNTQITLMLILVSVMFILLLLPMEVGSLHQRIAERPNTPKADATFILIFNITFHVANINYGINFFLYLLSGSKFRKDFRKIFFCQRKPPRQNSFQVANRVENNLDSEGNDAAESCETTGRKRYWSCKQTGTKHQWMLLLNKFCVHECSCCFWCLWWSASDCCQSEVTGTKLLLSKLVRQKLVRADVRQK